MPTSRSLLFSVFIPARFLVFYPALSSREPEETILSVSPGPVGKEACELIRLRNRCWLGELPAVPGDASQPRNQLLSRKVTFQVSFWDQPEKPYFSSAEAVPLSWISFSAPVPPALNFPVSLARRLHFTFRKPVAGNGLLVKSGEIQRSFISTEIL